MKKTIARFSALVLISTVSIFARAAMATDVSFEEDRNLPIVYLNVAVKAGSATDPDGQSGISNFMGEMLRRGTRSKTKEQIDLALDQMGAKLEVETRAEALILRGSVLSSQLDAFLALLREIVTAPSFPDREIRKLCSEITSGLLEEQGEDSAIGGVKFNEFLFRDHSYGKPVLGKIPDVEKFNRTKILAQYERLFVEPNLLVVGSGDAAKAKIDQWAKALGDNRPAGSAPEAEKLAAPHDAGSRRLEIVDKPDRTQTQVFMGQIGVRMTDNNFFPLYLGNYAFGGPSFSARLMLEIRVKRGWSYGASSNFRHGLQPRSWTVHLFPASKDTPAAVAQTLSMISDLREHGITPPEFDFAQRSLVNSSGFMYNTPQKRVENALLEKTLDLPDGFMKTYGPNLAKVKLADVNGALATYLKPDQLAITVLGTAADLKPALAKATGVSENAITVVPYTAP
jgi:zinc protease